VGENNLVGKRIQFVKQSKWSLEMKSKIEFAFSVGDLVWDDLTHQTVKVIGIEYRNGQRSKQDKRTACHTTGYWVNNSHVGGGRFPWELSSLDINGNHN
jgi:hypothetical protein